jgi:hypothetical protein
MSNYSIKKYHSHSKYGQILPNLVFVNFDLYLFAIVKKRILIKIV